MATQLVSSEFMLQLLKQLSEKTYGDGHTLSESSATNYVRTLWNLNGKVPFKSLTFLKAKEDIEKKLEPYAETTKKTILASIVSVLSLYKDKSAYKTIYKFYQDKMNAKAKLVGGADTSKKTEKQEENWITWDEVIKKKKDIMTEVDKFRDNKTIDAKQYGHLLELLILSLYTDVPPRRNQDYLDMMVTKTNTNKFLIPLSSRTNANWLWILKGNPTEMIFNKYKTFKKYGSQKVAIPFGDSERPLAWVINLYLKFRPMADKKAKEFPLLIAHNGSAINSGNAITRILNNIFEKKIGSSMLRHIYLSSKMNIQEMKDDATAMGHSLNEQQKYLKAESPPEHQDQPSPVPDSQ